MEDGFCEICINKYNSGKVVPRVLDCGHSFCTTCTTQLLKTKANKYCPNCRASLQKEISEDYPINYALLSLNGKLNNSVTREMLLKKRVNLMKIKYVSMETQLTENKQRSENNLLNIKYGLGSLQDLLDEEDNELVTDKVNRTLLDCQGKLEFAYICIPDYELRNSTSLSLDDYDNKEDFLLDIYNRISNHEEFYAVRRIKKEVKFARLTGWSNKLILHAFGPKVQKTDIKTIWFEDLKRSWDNNFRAFLEISCNERGKQQIIIIKASNSSLFLQFAKYFTGESGPVYKGASFYQGKSDHPYMKSLLKVNHLMLIGKQVIARREFVYGSGGLSTHNVDQIICTVSSDGTIEILQMLKTTRVGNVIGTIEESKNLKDKITHGNGLKIKDCGIVIEL